MKDRLLISAIVVCVSGSILSMCLFCLPKESTTDLEVLPAALQKIDGVRQATEVEVDYTIRNGASLPIRIVGIDKSCSCTGVDLPKRKLAPGESEVLTLKFDSGGLRGSVGVRTVLFYLKDGEERPNVLQIALQAEIDPDCAVEPERLQFGNGEPCVQHVFVSPRHVSDVQIREVRCNLRFFKARLLPRDDAANRQGVEVAFVPDEYYPDAGLAKLLLLTDSERQPVLTVPIEVVGQKRGPNSYPGEGGQPAGGSP